jgi:predicted ATP-dependent protease
VVIPRTNIPHLMLRADVVRAVEEGRFHVYAVDTIDESIELLTGRPAGAMDAEGNYPEGTVNGAVQARLRELAKKHKEATATQPKNEDGGS